MFSGQLSCLSDLLNRHAKVLCYFESIIHQTTSVPLESQNNLTVNQNISLNTSSDEQKIKATMK